MLLRLQRIKTANYSKRIVTLIFILHVSPRFRFIDSFQMIHKNVVLVKRAVCGQLL